MSEEQTVENVEKVEQVEKQANYALEISNLFHSFKNHKALNGVNFNVKEKSIHGFVGPNGAGKTTTLKAIATLLKPQKGTVKVFGMSKGTLYVQHCPMVNNNEGADWISDEEKIRNPYFGDKMMKCGKVKATIMASLKKNI